MRRRRPGKAEGWLALSPTHSGAPLRRLHPLERARAGVAPDLRGSLQRHLRGAERAGKYPSAADACEHALALKPDYALARNNLAVAKAGGAKEIG